MQNIFYIEIEQSSRLSRGSRHLSGISMRPLARSEPPFGHPQRPCPKQTLATCWEILFSAFGSLLCSSYAIHHEEPSFTESGSSMIAEAIDTSYFAFILNPSPTLLLFACLLLGCSISSFAYRRQREDVYQSLFFIVSITVSTIFGLALGMNANLIMLGLIPWALCFAMMCSVAIHWAVRRRTHGIYTRIKCCEIGEKVEHPLPSAGKE
ncbi:hypothetical protein BKA64DRAFT_473670 [Cadophora sp. MPI-SDFR-AT-0126]|nr:hypothetical protein BKA64DRAFT_473670 [Leotiomycetes sp. MPI-SDFR-AT-0126]